MITVHVIANRSSASRQERVVVLALGAVPIFALGLADGGFYPRPWGWATAGIALLAIVVTALRRELAVSRQALGLFTLLVALGIWIAASLLWTRSTSLSMFELERAVLYLCALGTAALLLRKRDACVLVIGVLLGASAITSWGLASYLLDREHPSDVFQGAYLHRPLGYANAMAITSVIAILLALGVTTDARRRADRMAASVALVPLTCALALTGSRAAWIAGGVGVGAALAASSRPMWSFAVWVPVLVIPGLVAAYVWTTDATDARLVGADADRLGDELLVLVVVASALALGPAALVTRKRVPLLPSSPAHRRTAILALVALAAGAVMAVALVGGLAGDRAMLWRVALAEFEDNPALGSGAGTYAQTWLERRPQPTMVRDAHSIELEAASDLGVVGVVLVVLLLAVPFAWARRARDKPLAAATAGAFAAFAVHASVDWDWELPAVTLAGLFCAAALAVAADVRNPVRVGSGGRSAVLALGAVVLAAGLAGFEGASAVEDASRMLARGSTAAAEQAARRAERWQPWAVEPLLLEGQARAFSGDRRGALGAYARAAARDPNDYRTWLALASVSRREDAAIAIARARALNRWAVRGP